MAELRENFESFIQNQKSEVAEAKAIAQGVAANLFELEQKIGEGPSVLGYSTHTGASLANSLVTSDAWGAVAGKRQIKSAIDVKAGSLLPAVEANTIKYDTGGLSVTEHQPGIVSGMTRRRWLRQRLVTVPTQGGSVEYSRELSFTNNAAPQGGGSPFEHEGVAKAESVITYELIDQKVATVAHFIKASKQILSDVSMLQNTLDARLRYGLEIAVENQLLNGTGVGANMSGLTKSGNYTAFTPTTGDTALDSISRAIATLEGNEAQPDVIILHPTDFRAMQRVKASGSGEYMFGAPGGTNNEAVWNRAVHVTPAMGTGNFLMLDTAQMGVFFTREDAQVHVGYVNDDFTSNLVTLLAELRATLAVQRPTAVIYGALTT